MMLASTRVEFARILSRQRWCSRQTSRTAHLEHAGAEQAEDLVSAIVDPASRWWDNPTVPISTADAKRRIVLPQAKPGDVFEVRTLAKGRLLLIRLEQPAPAPPMSKSRSLAAMSSAPLKPRMSWKALREMTREP
jgi:hypothetical protein